MKTSMKLFSLGLVLFSNVYAAGAYDLDVTATFSSNMAYDKKTNEFFNMSPKSDMNVHVMLLDSAKRSKVVEENLSKPGLTKLNIKLNGEIGTVYDNIINYSASGKMVLSKKMFNVNGLAGNFNTTNFESFDNMSKEIAVQKLGTENLELKVVPGLTAGTVNCNLTSPSVFNCVFKINYYYKVTDKSATPDPVPTPNIEPANTPVSITMIEKMGWNMSRNGSVLNLTSTFFDNTYSVDKELANGKIENLKVSKVDLASVKGNYSIETNGNQFKLLKENNSIAEGTFQGQVTPSGKATNYFFKSITAGIGGDKDLINSSLDEIRSDDLIGKKEMEFSAKDYVFSLTCFEGKTSASCDLTRTIKAYLK